MPPGPRPIGLVVVAVVFALMAVNDGTKVSPFLLGGDDDPPALSMLHLAAALAAAAVAVGSWRAARWAPVAALAWTVVTIALIASLDSLLDLPAEARPGLLLGAVIIAALGGVVAWYLRRRVTQPPPERV
jgi:hypothetical protein